MPLNDSISVNLAALTTETTVEFDDSREEDEVTVGGEPADEKAHARVGEHLDRVRALANTHAKARVASRNNFPAAAGLASSASAFAALSLAATRAAGLQLNERSLSVLARQGSGSAARSVPPGFVEWLAATGNTATSDQSFARQVMPPDAWDLRDIIAIVSTEPKVVGSLDGHSAVHSSPFLSERLSRLPIRYHRLRRELLAKSLRGMGPDVETEAIELHMMAMTSRPPIFYWKPATVRVMDAVRAWRADGLTAYFTLDAGPNVHILVEPDNADEVAKRVGELEGVLSVLASGPGAGAEISENDLF